MKDLRTGAGKFQDFLVRDEIKLAGLRHDPRIGTVDAVDVLEDLALVRTKRNGDGDGGCIRSAPSEDRDVLIFGPPLVARDDRDGSGIEFTVNASGVDVENLRLGVDRVGADPRLEPGEGNGVVPLGLQGHRHERGGDNLSGGKQQGQFAVARVGRDTLGDRQEVVGGVPHG